MLLLFKSFHKICKFGEIIKGHFNMKIDILLTMVSNKPYKDTLEEHSIISWCIWFVRTSK